MDAPIIIIGAARSGTKFLRDILAAGHGTCAVPYDVNFVWRCGIDQDSHDRLDPSELTQERSQAIREILSRMAKARAGQCFIEKTVSNTLRVPFVASVFPDARFVHLIRDGRDVTESAMRQWQAPPNWHALVTKLRDLPFRYLGYALWYARNTGLGLLSGRMGGKVWGPRYPGIELDARTKSLVELCALQWQHSVVCALTDLALLPAERIFEIRYEDLVADPNVLSQLVTSLQLPDREAILSAYRTRLRTSDGGRWRELPEHERAKLHEVLGLTLRDLGYMTQ